MKTREQLTEAILAARGQNGRIRTWRLVARELYPHLDSNATGALLNKILKHPEYYPGEGVCARLSLVYYRPTPVCSKHGIVHCYNCETEEVKPIRETKKKSRPRPSYKRLYVNLALLLMSVLNEGDSK